MIVLDAPLDQDLLEKAKAFSAFRKACKTWLAAHRLCFDKFTIREHDSFIGYIAEHKVCQYLSQLFPDAALELWDEAFDLKLINSIIRGQLVDAESARYVCDYFYDRWDIAITLNEQTICADVKTAATKNSPKPEWDFLYPVVQARKEGKDVAILAYYITNSEAIEDFKQLSVVGFVDEASIRKCSIRQKGTHTIHKTESQIDNYETIVGKHYRPLTELFAGVPPNGVPCV
jgi:hypothetical protein